MKNEGNLEKVITYFYIKIIIFYLIIIKIKIRMKMRVMDVKYILII